MPITCNKKGVWSIDDVHKKVNSGTGFWVTYSDLGSPGCLYMWGDNQDGRLGLNDRTSRSSPVQVPGSLWNVVSAGAGHAGGIKKDGTLWMWGKNDDGTLGTNNRIYYSSPVQVPGTQWSDVSVSYNSVTSALKTDGTLWVWGNNTWGVIGTFDGSIHRSSPTQIPGTQWLSLNRNNQAYHTSALKADGTWWAWGLQSPHGTPRINSNSGDASSPIQIPGTQWCQISGLAAQVSNVGGIKTDGTLWRWGAGTWGTTGDNCNVHRSSPVQIPGTQWVETQAGLYHTYGRKTDGTLWAWGFNSCGQLGTNDRVCYSSPVQIPGTTWTSIRTGRSTGIATKSDGTLWVWGQNNNGSLGNSTTTAHVSSPVQIPGTQWILGDKALAMDEGPAGAIRLS